MWKIWALVSLLMVSTLGTSSAKTQRELTNDLEGSGFPELSKLHPNYENEEGSGFASGDDNDMDDSKEPIDDEDDEMDNRIDEGSDDLTDVVEGPILSNEVQLVKNALPQDNNGNRVAMASTNNGDSVFESTEMLAAMIAGGTIGLLFAILLILLLVYRMRKKDEGSYDLSKKPIYKKAPTTEFYA
uniref:syndecan-4 n=1 Tax=Pristiophorus japonicus TaxID=55135 RepID=UPI00398F8C48